MTAAATVPSTATAISRTEPRPAAVRRSFRFELVKLLAQWRIRLLLLVCWVVPALLVAIISNQSTLPSDTVFGRWMSQSSWAGPLVVLSFSCSWVLPLLTSLVAGDVFASEDRSGTWRHLLVAVRSPRRIFATKTLASVTVVLLLFVGLAASAIVGGLVGVGSQHLVGLDGHLLAPGAAANAVALAWLSVLAPTMAFAAVGLLGSVAFGRSPMGLLTPVLLAFVLQMAQLLPLPVVVRVALPSYAFLAWRGLFTDPMQTGPLVIGIVVSMIWATVATALAYRLFMRRDFTDQAYDGAGRRIAVRAGLPLSALLAATIGVVALVTPASGSGIDSGKLQSSLATAYGHLYRLQTNELHRPVVTEQQMATTASCNKGGDMAVSTGPGNDWRCVVTWHIPGAKATGSAIYQLDVTADGRFIADGDGPQSVNGFFQVHTPTGDAPNPLWQFDGTVDLLAPVSKG